MELDRESIEKKDFPSARQGYDRAAVDAHLAAIADELDRRDQSRGQTLASSASDHVRAIVDAAEKSAAQIQREAEDRATRTREHAARQARERVAKVSELTATILGQLEDGRRRLETMIGSPPETDVATGAGAAAQTQAVPAAEPVAQGSADAGNGAGTLVPEPAAEPATASQADVEPATASQADAEPAAASQADAEPAATSQAEAVDAVEGARLVALNMALNGSPRDETAKYLAEHFELSDRDRLLDEVYASVGG